MPFLEGRNSNLHHVDRGPDGKVGLMQVRAVLGQSLRCAGLAGRGVAEVVD